MDKREDTKDLTASPDENEAPRGTVTIAEILADFKTQIDAALKAATEQAYTRFVNDADVWTRENVEINTEDHAREFIRQMLAGEDPAYVTRRIKEYGFDQADKIRDLIWKQCGDELVKKSLEVKDAEIASLKKHLSERRW